MMRENRSEQSRRYWAGLCVYLRQRGSELESLEPMVSDYKHYRDFQIGIPGLAVRASQRVRKGLGAAFILRGPNATSELQSLQEQQAEIENECGESLSWYAVSSEKRVAFINTDVDVTNATDWCNQHEWLATHLEKLVEVFRPRILELRAADYDPLEDLDDVEDIDPEAEDISNDFDDTEDMDAAVALAKAFKEAQALEEQDEYVTSPSESNMPMHAYVVMLHLVSQGYSDFTEIRKVLCRESAGTYYITILDHIFRKLKTLEKEWGESIPPITALVFNTDGRAPKWTCEILTGDGDVQPTAKQVAELAASVTAYDEWDKVLKALKP
ncbi:hypothetical protein C6503_03815 [Candidatus Poribacteria bacterium]|nr:MAG: hypothetical protein C6503_03815 [Candidatus Poribacteria bacterium]